MRYCGIVAGGSFVHLCALEELRVEEPPIRLEALFYEPASPQQVSAEIGAFGQSGEGFFRISLTVPDERLTEAVERLRSSLAG